MTKLTEQLGVPILTANTNGKLLGEKELMELNEFIKAKNIEQPNKELMIIKTIQGLISQVNEKLGELDKITAPATKCKTLIGQALDDMDIFQRTKLAELQKAFE